MSKKSFDLELEKRKPIWKTLSLLYLDTELEEVDYTLIAKELSKSKRTITSLKKIDQFEVYPSLMINLLSVAGVWTEFDEDWLNKRCTNAFRKRNTVSYQLKNWFYAQFFKKMRAENWIEIEKRMKEIHSKL